MKSMDLWDPLLKFCGNCAMINDKVNAAASGPAAVVKGISHDSYRLRVLKSTVLHSKAPEIWAPFSQASPRLTA